MRLEDGSLVTEIGPFPPRRDSGASSLTSRAGDSGLRRILDTVIDARRAARRGARRLDHPPQTARALMLQQRSDQELLREYHERGNVAAREELIERNLSLVRSLARRYAYRGEQFDDLVQIGTIGLIKAIDRFDIDRGVELTTFATPNIIGEIKRHFRDKGWAVRVPRGLQELNVQLSKLVEQLTVELGRSPSIPELAKAAEVEPEQVLEALESGARLHLRVALRRRRWATRKASSIRSSRSGGGAAVRDRRGLGQRDARTADARRPREGDPPAAVLRRAHPVPDRHSRSGSRRCTSPA